MKRRNNYIQLKLWSIPVLVLYSLFFTVQVFFNFDTAIIAANVGNQSAVFAGKKEQSIQIVAAHGRSEKSQHSKIRLNKRFQPASCPALNPVYITAPVIFIEEPAPTVYSTPYHASPNLFTRSLRGPPAVVYPFV